VPVRRCALIWLLRHGGATWTSCPLGWSMTRVWPGWRSWPMARDLHEVRPAAADGHASAQLAIAAMAAA
jgi:hypothetical protein